jgi:DNA-binding GntR family transcriptional regulator
MESWFSNPPSARRQTAVHDQVYEAIRQAPDHRPHRAGRRVSLRSLAAELGVSPMPVRDAVRRLVAERALAINPANKRLSVPSLTADRLEQLSPGPAVDRAGAGRPRRASTPTPP